MSIQADSSRILIVHPGRPDEVCRCAPLAVSLRKAWPKAKIDWVVDIEAAPLLTSRRSSEEVLSLSQRSAGGLLQRLHRRSQVREFLSKLNKRSYDIVLDTCGQDGSGRFARATEAPVRLGFDDADRISRRCYTHYVNRSTSSGDKLHNTDAALKLLTPLNVPPVNESDLVPPAEDIQWWNEFRRNHSSDIADSSYAVLAPGSRLAHKRWPIERWAELIGPLLARGFERIVLLGLAEETPLLQPLRDLAKRVNETDDGLMIDLIGKTSIGQMMATIAASGLTVSNDTLPLAVADGLRCPCVGLFGPTDPNLTGPYQQPIGGLRVFVPSPNEIVSSSDPKLGNATMRVISTAAVIQRIDRVMNLVSKEVQQVEDNHRHHAARARSRS